jgi:hypothetical protein
VVHLKKVPQSRAVMAARRTHAFVNYSDVGIERKLTVGLALQPLPTCVVPKRGHTSQPRFGRHASELWRNMMNENMSPTDQIAPGQKNYAAAESSTRPT